MPVLKPLARRGRAAACRRLDLPGGLRRRAAPESPSSTSRCARSPAEARGAYLRRRCAVDFPAPSVFPEPIAFNVVPLRRARSSRTARRRPTRSRSSATRAARSSASPTSRSTAPACASRSSPATPSPCTLEFARPISPDRGAPGSLPTRRASSSTTCRRRSRRPARTPSLVGRIRARPDRRRTASSLFVVGRQPAQGRRAQRGPDRRAARRQCRPERSQLSRRGRTGSRVP